MIDVRGLRGRNPTHVSFSPDSQSLLLWDLGWIRSESRVESGQFYLLDVAAFAADGTIKVTHLGEMPMGGWAWLSVSGIMWEVIIPSSAQTVQAERPRKRRVEGKEGAG